MSHKVNLPSIPMGAKVSTPLGDGEVVDVEVNAVGMPPYTVRYGVRLEDDMDRPWLDDNTAHFFEKEVKLKQKQA